MARLSRITAAVSSTSSMTAAVVVDASHALDVRDIAHACGVEIEWIVQLVQIGIVGTTPPGATRDEWRFHSADLQRALEARRLERDYGVDLDAAALILDLQGEIRRLRAALVASGRGHESA